MAALLVGSVSNGSGLGPEKWFGLVPDPSNTLTGSFLVGQTGNSTRKLGTVPVNWRGLPGVARPVSSNLRFSFWGFSVYGRSQI
jgi:hypothetical protein